VSDFTDLYDYKDVNGFNEYVVPALEIINIAYDMSTEQVEKLISRSREVVQAFSANEDERLFWGIAESGGRPVVGLSSYALYAADKTGRGIFLDDYMWGETLNPALINVGWYNNPVYHAIAAVTVGDLIGVNSQWSADHFNFLTLPWTDVVGPLPEIIIPGKKLYVGPSGVDTFTEGVGWPM